MNARLFVCNRPTSADVNVIAGWVDDNDASPVREFAIDTQHVRDVPMGAVHFVYQGLCWQTTKHRFFSGGLRVVITCTPLFNDAEGNKMILTDMILN